MRTTTLTHRLRATLAAEADQVAPAERPLVATGGVRPSRTSRGPWLVAAAALTVVLGTAGAIAVRGADKADAVSIHDPYMAAAGDGTLIPGWAPEGMRLWEVEWGEADARHIAIERWTTQLFGRSGQVADGALYIQMRGNFTGGIPSEGDPITVRGQEGTAVPARGYNETDAIVWSESGVEVHASYRGMSRDEAVAALDGLARRSDDPMAGFDPASGFDLVGEVLPAPDARVLTAIFRYIDEDLKQVTVLTSSATGGPSSGYLGSLFRGQNPVDGVVESGDPADWFHRYWANGQSVEVMNTQTAIDEATVRQLADSVGPATEAELNEISDQLAEGVTQLPLLASAAFDAGTVELRGEGMAVALCLRPDGGSGPVCPSRGNEEGPVWATVEIDGTTYVATAGTDLTTKVVAADPSELTDPEAPALPGESATDGEFILTLTPIPADVPAAEVLFENGGSGAVPRADS